MRTSVIVFALVLVLVLAFAEGFSPSKIWAKMRGKKTAPQKPSLSDTIDDFLKTPPVFYPEELTSVNPGNQMPSISSGANYLPAGQTKALYYRQRRHRDYDEDDLYNYEGHCSRRRRHYHY
jgi:hypothetical protein